MKIECKCLDHFQHARISKHDSHDSLCLVALSFTGRDGGGHKRSYSRCVERQQNIVAMDQVEKVITLMHLCICLCACTMVQCLATTSACDVQKTHEEACERSHFFSYQVSLPQPLFGFYLCSFHMF